MSQRESGYERKERDLYETPEWVTEALLPHIENRIDGPIWEPAAASGKMVRPLEALGWPVLGTDIATGDDFLAKTKADWDFDFIITNPPYEHAREFIQHAIRMTMPGGLVAMLLRTDFDHAKTRANLFGQSQHFAKKIVLTKRIKWFEDSDGQPSFNHAWFVWDWKHRGPPTLAYGPTSITSSQEPQLISAIAKVCGLPRCIPQNPERDGHHWVKRYRGGPAIALFWNAQWWRNADRGWGSYEEPDRESQWEYLGPCLTPEERDRLRSELAHAREALEKIGATEDVPIGQGRFMTVSQLSAPEMARVARTALTPHKETAE